MGNILSCHSNDLIIGHPYLIEVKNIRIRSVKFNPGFLRNIFRRIEWNIIFSCSRALGFSKLPKQVDIIVLAEIKFLRAFHYALLELELDNGFLVSPQSGRKFEIKEGVLNLLS